MDKLPRKSKTEKTEKKCYWCGKLLNPSKHFCGHCGKDNSISDEEKRKISDAYFDSM